MVQNSEYNDLTILNAFVHFRLEAIKMGKKKKEKKNPQFSKQSSKLLSFFSLPPWPLPPLP